MKKVHFLPLSLILMSYGFANNHNKENTPQVEQTAIKQSEQTEQVPALSEPKNEPALLLVDNEYGHNLPNQRQKPVRSAAPLIREHNLPRSRDTLKQKAQPAHETVVVQKSEQAIEDSSDVDEAYEEEHAPQTVVQQSEQAVEDSSDVDEAYEEEHAPQTVVQQSEQAIEDSSDADETYQEEHAPQTVVQSEQAIEDSSDVDEACEEGRAPQTLTLTRRRVVVQQSEHAIEDSSDMDEAYEEEQVPQASQQVDRFNRRKQKPVVQKQAVPADKKSTRSNDLHKPKKPTVRPPSVVQNDQKKSHRAEHRVNVKQKELKGKSIAKKNNSVQSQASTPKNQLQRPVAQDSSVQDSRSIISQDQNNGMKQFPSQPMQGSSENPAQGINIPVRPVIDDSLDFWIEGEALVWQALEENLTYAYKGFNNSGFFNAPNVERDLKTVDFNWDWGFRVGLGCNMPYDGWDLNVYWTRIQNKAHGSISSNDTESLFELWVNANNVNNTGSNFHSHWRNELNQVDLNLGREYLVGRHLAIRPNVGMRSTWDSQKYKIDYDFFLGLDQDVHLKNRFWGFGFVGGFDSDWRLGYGFSIYGNTDIAVLLGFFDVDEQGKAGGSTIWKLSKSFRTGRPIFDLALGFKWCSNFWDNTMAFTIKAGYEYHLYFNQNQFILSTGNPDFELFNPVGGDLTYQGVTVSMQFDF